MDIYRAGVYPIVNENFTPVPISHERLTVQAVRRGAETVFDAWQDNMHEADCSAHPWYQLGRNWAFRTLRRDIEHYFTDDGTELRPWAIDVLRARETAARSAIATTEWHPDAGSCLAMRRGAQSGVQEFLYLVSLHRRPV